MREPEEPPHCPHCGHLGTRSGNDMPLSYAVRRTSFDRPSSFRCNCCYQTFTAEEVTDAGWISEANEKAFPDSKPEPVDTIEDFDADCDCVRCENGVTHFDALR